MARQLTQEHRKKIGKANAETWAALTPEERREKKEAALLARKRNLQLYRIRKGLQPKHFQASSAIVDTDFDEGL